MKKKIIFVVVLLIYVLYVGFVFLKSNDKKDSDPRTTTITEPETELDFPKPTAKVISSQEILLSQLVPDEKDFDLSSRLLDVFAPLGALDPLANEEGSVEVIAIQNISFGYFFSKYGIDEDDAVMYLESPLKYSSIKFDQDDYFSQNKEILEEILSDYHSMDEISVWGYWTSGINRVNNIFIDSHQDIAWKLPETEDEYYDFSKVDLAPFDQISKEFPEIEAWDYETLGDVRKNANSINVTSLYKCDGKTIFTMGATSNNAFGFIYGAESADEVNCGLLDGRFRIVEEQKMDNNWIFWIAR